MLTARHASRTASKALTPARTITPPAVRAERAARPGARLLRRHSQQPSADWPLAYADLELDPLTREARCGAALQPPRRSLTCCTVPAPPAPGAHPRQHPPGGLGATSTATQRADVTSATCAARLMGGEPRLIQTIRGVGYSRGEK
jgi:DNA-binding response OmpR family regulator